MPKRKPIVSGNLCRWGVFRSKASAADRCFAGWTCLLSESGELVFTNSASGLDEVQVEKPFGRFYTVEAARHSTGLGLTIAKTLTEQIGGSIAATYRDGQLSICIVFPEEKDIE